MQVDLLTVLGTILVVTSLAFVNWVQKGVAAYQGQQARERQVVLDTLHQSGAALVEELHSQISLLQLEVAALRKELADLRVVTQRELRASEGRAELAEQRAAELETRIVRMQNDRGK